MSDDTPKSRAELRRMFWHDFAGTIADNMVEVNWILVITLAPALLGAPRDAITTMFGLTDVLWVVFLNWLGWGLLAVYAVGLVVAGLQTWVFEAYLRRRQITL